MRKQYHLRSSERGPLAWDVDRLVALSKNFPRRQVPLAEIRELDEPYWFGPGDVPTCRAVAAHARLIEETDLRHPIILFADGRVADGMHRVCKAVAWQHPTIEAVQFVTDPAPDYVGLDPGVLPYEEEVP